MWSAQFFNLNKPRHFVTSGGLGTMGYGLPAAMGAKIGCPGSTVVLFTGDGSIMMNCQEFATLHKYGVDVKVVVLHNNVLGMVNQWQRMFYSGHCSQSVIADNPDLTALSRAWVFPAPVSAVRKNWMMPYPGYSKRRGRPCSMYSFRLMKMCIPWFPAENDWIKWYWEVKASDETAPGTTLRQ